MAKSKKEALNEIIYDKRIRIVFQPIVSLIDGSVLGYEALSRIIGENIIENPDMLFYLAGKYNRIWDLELLCRTKTLEAVNELMGPDFNKKIFINVNPRIIYDKALQKGFTKDFLNSYHINSKNIIFEITERNVIVDMKGFISSIDHYRSQDYQIAIDDAGAGYSGLNLISDIHPDYIKLDMKLIRGINADSIKFALVKGMIEFSKVTNTFLIAEGIETFEELQTLVELGVHYGQGYLIQKPSSTIKEFYDEFTDLLKRITIEKCNQQNYDNFNIPIAEVCTYTETVHANEPVPYVYEYFKHNPDSIGLCIIDDGVPLGIITKEKLNNHLSGFYGFALNQKKVISQVMDETYLSVESMTSISEVSTIALSRITDKLYDFIVVTENGKYIGTVTIKDLLQKTTEIKVTMAKHLNPLSGLPGNLIIENKLNQCIVNHAEYTVAYIDIDNFKAYNDVYGFEKGDLVIKLLVDIFKGIMTDSFIGHIGGDDFIIIINKYVDHIFFTSISQQFEMLVKSFYNHEDIVNGYIVAKNRIGKIEKFPLCGLTIVTVDNQTRKFSNIFELTELLAELKKEAKLIKSSGLILQ